MKKEENTKNENTLQGWSDIILGKRENNMKNCKKCGCDVNKSGYCTDLTCPYSCHKQDENPVPFEPGVKNPPKTWTEG